MQERATAAGVRTVIGLQGRSDPTVMYMADLIADGWIGEVIAANLSAMGAGVLERPAARMTMNAFLIGGGHNTDILAALVGEFVDVSATVTTRVPEVRITDTGEMRPISFPDQALFSGTLDSGAVAQVTIASVPFNSPTNRIEVYGRAGTLVLTGQSLAQGPNILIGAQGKDPLQEMTTPDSYYLMPEGAPKGSPYNVGQTYLRYVGGHSEAPAPDFAVELQRHRLLEAIQLSSDKGQRVRLTDIP